MIVATHVVVHVGGPHDLAVIVAGDKVLHLPEGGDELVVIEGL